VKTLPLIGGLAVAALAFSMSGCVSSPESFTLRVRIDVPIYVEPNNNDRPRVGSACDGGAQGDIGPLAGETLQVKDESGKTIQSQVLGDGKIVNHSEYGQSCRFVVRVSEVPASASQYQLKVGDLASPLATNKQARSGLELGPSGSAAVTPTGGGNRWRALLPVMLVGAGIDKTGARDSTVAIQAIIDANPGRVLLLPAGVYKITALTLSKGQHLAGVGQQDWRDRFSSFGTAGWLLNENFNGTVIRSTLTAGSAITIVDTEVNSGGLSDFTLIGPGTGTSVGIVWGSTTVTVVNALVRSVKVGNFAVCVRMNLVNEGSFYDLMIRGCSLGLDLASQTNQNAFYTLDIQWCGDGLHVSANSNANAFYSMIGQSNSGIAAVVSGSKNVFYNPYFENNTTRAVDILSGAMGNKLDSPLQNGESDAIRVQAGAGDSALTGIGWQGGVATVVNAGDRTYIQGRISRLTDTGNSTIIVDPLIPGTAYGARP
jgi:hypothetical protein